MTATTPSSNLVDLSGLRLHYLDWGGAGPTLLFLSGLGSTAYIFDRFDPRFADRFHVLGLTRSGHGDSGLPGCRLRCCHAGR